MRFTILQDLKKMKQWWKNLLIMLRQCRGLRKINEVYSEQNKLNIGENFDNLVY